MDERETTLGDEDIRSEIRQGGTWGEQPGDDADTTDTDTDTDTDDTDVDADDADQDADADDPS